MRIGEVARRSGVSTRMLRHYDRLGLVSATGRSSGGYRDYSDSDVQRLFHVESLRTLGMTLREIGTALDAAEFAPADLVAALIDRTRRRIAAEEELLGRLRHIAQADPGDLREVLDVVALLRGLASDSGARRIQAVLSPPAAVPIAEIATTALAEEDLNVFGALCWLLARAGDAAIEPLTEGLRSPDPHVRIRAVVAIGGIDSDRVKPVLRPALTDIDDEVRDGAAVALGARGSADAIDALMSMIVAGRRDVEAAETLGLLADAPDVSETIATGVRRSLDGAPVDVRLRLAQALAEVPGPAARAVLEDLVSDPAHVVAATAAAILASSVEGS